MAGADLGFLERGGLIQGTKLSGGDVLQHVKHAGTRGSGGMPPPGNFLKQMLRYCNLEIFPHM